MQPLERIDASRKWLASSFSYRLVLHGARISEIRPMSDGIYDIVLGERAVLRSGRRYAHKLSSSLVF
jgi:hypothetical protein